MAEQKTVLTTEQIAALTAEIEGFQNKSLEYAASSQTLSAHYHRLYMASKAFLKRADRLARTAKDKAYTEAKKSKRTGTASASTTGNTAQTSKQKAS